jgi:hypothetical protein
LYRYWLPPRLITGNIRANHTFHESFANTVEALGSVFSHMPLSDHVFYPLNSYVRQNEKMRDVLVRAAARGAERRFTMLFLSYFEANLTAEHASDRTCEQVAETAGCASGQYSLSRELTEVSFGLKPGFRETTTPAYFDLLDMGAEYQALADGNWLEKRENQSFAREVAALFWEAAGKP